MNTRQRNQQGFTLVEMMVSLTAMLIITVAIFSVIVTEQRTHLTEGRRLDMNQGARVIEQMFSEGFRSAGSVLSMAKTGVLLNSEIIPFNGIYPLNNIAYPDGVILASGDPMALTRLTQVFTPGDNKIYVVSVNLPKDPEGIIPDAVAWHANDYGMIMRSNGYYMFKVANVEPLLNATQLSIRTTAAYYSGLLNTNGYKDNNSSGLGAYPVDSPVVRLEYFKIFLVRTEEDGSRTLTLTTDCEDQSDIFANTLPITDTRAIPILPNIEDIQIEYLTKVVPPDIWAGPDTVNFPGSGSNFYKQFFDKNIASARISVLLRTEEERNKKMGSGITFTKPTMGEVGPIKLPVGRYHYSFMQYEVLIRNY